MAHVIKKLIYAGPKVCDCIEFVQSIDSDDEDKSGISIRPSQWCQVYENGDDEMKYGKCEIELDYDATIELKNFLINNFAAD